MNDNNGTKKTQKTEKSDNYVKTFRDGAVAANIFKRTAPGGFEYLVFSLSRAWKTAQGKEGYSPNFFNKNRKAIHTVVDQACAFIEATQGTTHTGQQNLSSDAQKAA